MKTNQNLINRWQVRRKIERVSLLMGCWAARLSLTSSFARVVHVPALLFSRQRQSPSRFYIAWGFWSFFLFHSLLIARWAFKWKINENICFLEACPVFLWACAVCWKRVVGLGFIEMNGVHRARDIFGLLALIVVFLAVEICHEGNCCNCFFFVTFPLRYF